MSSWSRLSKWLRSKRDRTAVAQECEPRILYSADLNPALWMASAEAPPASVQIALLHPASVETRIGTQALESARVGHEIVFVDSGVADAKILIDSVLAGRQAGTEIDLVILKAGSDGLTQISEVLKHVSDIDALHIISHGSAGLLQLGDAKIDAQALRDRHAELNHWGIALSRDADVLLYGCDVGLGQMGAAFVAELAYATQADVAASVDITGSQSTVGNWTLERVHGAVEAGTLSDSKGVWDGSLATYTVTHTGDSGVGSLRQAITDSNATTTIDDTIVFNIAGTGVHTLTLSSTLPAISDTVNLDATTDDSFAANSNRPAIILDGNSGAGHGLRLTTDADGSTIRGLVIRNFASAGIHVQAYSTGNTIVGNYIGAMDAAGEFTDASDRNGFAGLILEGDNNQVGGTTAADRNVFSGNTGAGIEVSGQSNVVTGNYIGTDYTGTVVLGNGSNGVLIDRGTGSVVGGTSTAAGNLIRGATNAGVGVGGPSLGSDNAILGNRIYGNGALGIDLHESDWGDSGQTPNDANDVDTGQNGLQNYPVLTSAGNSGANFSIVGSINTTATTNLRIEYFSSPTGDASGYGEGQVYLGHLDVTTDGSGNASVSTVLSGVNVTVGHVVSATATVNLGGGNHGNTSEFSLNVIASSPGPVVTTTGGAQAYTENAAATAIDSGVTVTGGDSPSLTGATVTISANYASAEDVLAFTAQNGITGSWDVGTGVMTLSGTATVAHYQTALRSVTYANSSNHPSTLTRTVSFVADDGAYLGNVATRDISITAVNDAPYAIGPLSTVLDENSTAGTVVLTLQALDPDAVDTFTYVLLGDAGGRFVLNSSGSMVQVNSGAELDYESDTAFSLTVRATDASGLSWVQSLQVSLRDVAEPALELRAGDDVPGTPLPQLWEQLSAQPSTPTVPNLEPAPAVPVPGPVPTPPAEPPSPVAVVPDLQPTLPTLPTPQQLQFTIRVDEVESVRSFQVKVPHEAHQPQTEVSPAAELITVSFEPITNFEALPLDTVPPQYFVDESTGLPGYRIPRERVGRADHVAAIDESAQAELSKQTSGSAQAFLTTPMQVTGLTLTAGLLWWLTRSGGLITTILVGVPAWRHVDLLPVLALQTEDGSEYAQEAHEHSRPMKDGVAAGDDVQGSIEVEFFTRAETAKRTALPPT